MTRKIVTVDEALRLPEEVEAALKGELNAHFSSLSNTAVNAASQASAAAQAAQDAADSVIVPDDQRVASLVRMPSSDTRVAIEEVLFGGEQGTKRAITMTRPRRNASGIISYNGAAHIQDNVTTAGGYHYAVWWGHDLKPYIGQKPMNSTKWIVFDLSTVSGNPLQSPVALDGHNALVVAVDLNGRIHVWGNYHGTGLKYVRSSNSHSIQSWVTGSMVGTNESAMTYPVPVTGSDGTLWFFYRDGISGNGDQIVNKFNPTNNTWTRVAKLIDGKTDNDSPYLNHIAPGPSGELHIFYSWRSSGNAASNNDFAYVRLLPNGTAQRVNNTPQTLPIRHSTSDLIWDTPNTGSGMLNQQGADVDNMGRPHAAMWRYDTNGDTQVYHVWHNGTSWITEQATNFNRRIDLNVSTFQPSLSRVQVFCPRQGGTYLLYRRNYEGGRGRIKAIDVTPGHDRVEFDLVDLDMYDWEPTYDTRALKERNELTMLLIPLAANWQNSVSAPWNDISNWNNQVVLHTVIDLSQIRSFAAGTVDLPRIETVKNRGGPGSGTPITATGTSDFQHGPLPIVLRDDELWFVRYDARVGAVGTTTSLNVEVRLNRELGGGNSVQTGRTRVTNVGVAYVDTAWMHVHNMTDAGHGGFVVLYAFKEGTGTTTISVANLEVGRLHGLLT